MKLFKYLFFIAMMTGSLSLLLTEIVEAKSAPSKVKNINLGTDILETNVNTSTASSIYYGTYSGQPIKWKIIGFNGNGVSSNKGEMTLLANDTIVSNIKYNNTTPYKNSYAGSDLQTQIDSLLATRFAFIESLAIKTRDLSVCPVPGSKHSDDHTDITGRYYCDGIAGEEVKATYLWPLSTTEAVAVDKDIRKASSWWWLRSPGYYDDYGYDAAYVNIHGIVYEYGHRVYKQPGAIRPAFNLNLSSVLYIYTGGESRIDTLHTTTDENVLKTWNVTLQGGTGFVAERKSGETGNVKKGEKLTVNVTNCGIPYAGSFLAFNQIAAMIVDANGTVAAYGKITDNVKEGKIEVTIPNDNQIKAGIYTLKVFAEQLNSNNQTSYATNMADIAVTIEDAPAISVKKEKQKTKWWLKIFN